MSHIIFENLLENIYESSNHVINFMNNKEKYFANAYRTISDVPNNNILSYFFIVLFIYAIFKNANIQISNVFTLLLSITIIYLLLQRDYNNFNKFIDKNNDKLKFLNSFLTMQDNIQRGTLENIMSVRSESRVFSYLYYDSNIVEVLYNLKEYVNLNISSYTDCIKSINSLLKISFISEELNYNLVDNFNTMIILKNQALNSLTTIIYCLPTGYVTYNKFKEAIKTLHIILNSHITKTSKVFKNKVRKRDSYHHNIPLDRFDFYDSVSANDMKLKDYNSTYDLY